jgi:hypothetical protein
VGIVSQVLLVMLKLKMVLLESVFCEISYLHEVVFGEIGDVCMLDMWDIRGLEKPDIHDCGVALLRG